MDALLDWWVTLARSPWLGARERAIWPCNKQCPIFALPTSAVLDSCDRPVGDFMVETVLDGDDLFRLRVHPVNGEMEVWPFIVSRWSA